MPDSLEPQPASGPVSRRGFLKMTGALAGGSVLAWMGEAPAPPAALPARPHLLILVSDQERYPRYWPAGWADTNLPNHKRLADHGLTFQRAFCNTSMCSPSRATLFTGLYPAQHGLERTGTPAYQLPNYMQNLAKMLASAGYNVQLRGKWHLSYKADGTYPPTSAEVAAFGFQGWEPTNAGEGTEVTGFGGGCAQNDQAIADEAIAFLNSAAAQSSTPFALIVTFVNPHDVLAYPNTWDDDACGGSEYAATADFDQGILYTDIPSRDEDLSTKPTAQQESLALFASGLGAIGTPAQPPGNLKPREYVNFYAQLHKFVDAQLGRVLDAVKNPNHPAQLRDDVVVVYTSDHGEMGLSHGGLRQKMYNAYEETIHVPLIISNPVLFPAAQTTAALASLVDLMPTLASVAQVPHPEHWHFSGVDLSPVLSNPAAAVQDAILFTFDDQDAGQAAPPPALVAVGQPNHIRCVREVNWKYARYFDPAGGEAEQFELYDLANDPDELTNLAASTAPAIVAEKNRLAQRLADLEAARLQPFSALRLPQILR